MKKYLAILAYYIGIITVSTLVGTALATYAPWWELIPLTVIAVCGAAYIDYHHSFGNNNSMKENNR